MGFRKEEKLYIKKENLLEFKSFLFSKNVKQPYKSRTVQSLYFDNNKFEMFKDSIEGLQPRKKLRVRNYPGTNDQNFYFEVKYSSNEGRFKKKEIITKINYDEKNLYGIFDSQYVLCFTQIFIKYNRDYFIIDDVRISIDNDITYTKFLNNHITKDPRSIVEIKTNINKDQDNLWSDFPFERTRFSKYCSGIDFLSIIQ